MEIFAYIAHKDGYWAGVCSPKVGKHELRKFLGDFAQAGFGISSVETREEYNRLLDPMKEWSESPEYKAKHERSEAGRLSLRDCERAGA